MKNIETKKKIIQIFLGSWIAISIIFMALSLYAFGQSVAEYRHFATFNDWKSFQTANAKNFFKNNFYYFKGRLKKVFISNNSIRERLKENGFDYINLETLPADLHSLDSDLPASGRSYIEGEINLEKGKKEPVLLKYRGDNFYHWGFPKKSFKIKFDDDRIINLINPKEIDFIADKIAFNLAEEMGLYFSGVKFTGLFINNDFKGIFLETEEPNTEYIRNHSLPFRAVFQGESIGPDRQGLGLFQDSNKWDLDGGYLSKKSLEPFLRALNEGNFKGIYQNINFDYWVNFYTFVSLIQNSHFDDAHNWFWGVHGDRFYPIVWDPVGWVMRTGSGEGVEEMKSMISQTFRKNVYFSSSFSHQLWQRVNDSGLLERMFQEMDEISLSLENVLDYDFYKGGIFGNSKGARSPQTTEEILEEIAGLRSKIQDRFDFLKNALSKASASYYIDDRDNWLYLQYSGIAPAEIKQIYRGVPFVNYSTVEVFNNLQYFPLPLDLNQIVSGRVSAGGPFPYAKVCPMSYRVKVNSRLGGLIEPKLVNSLSKEEIDLKEVNEFSPTDCMMDFTSPGETKFGKQTINNQKRENNSLEITFSTINPADYFDFDRNDEDETKMTLGAEKYDKVFFKKEEFSKNIELEFKKQEYLGRENWYLSPIDFNSGFLFYSQSLARSLGFPIKKQELLSVFGNEFYIGEYFLKEAAENKAFFEVNGLTFDTDIYKLEGEDSLKRKNWQKISTDPRKEVDDDETLKGLLDSLNDPNALFKIIDWQNFANFYSYLILARDEFPQYLLYFDNTLGRFKFIPDKEKFYRANQGFDIYDPLVQEILKKDFVWEILAEKIGRDIDGILSKIIQQYQGTGKQYQEKIENSFVYWSDSDEGQGREYFTNQEKILRNNFSILNGKAQELVERKDESLIQEMIESSQKEFWQKDSIFTLGDEDKVILIKEGNHSIKKDVIIPPGLTVVIEPGAVLEMGSKASIVSLSPIIAEGTEDKPIKVIPLKEKKPWGVIAVLGTGSRESQFEQMIFQGGSETFLNNVYLSGQLSIYHADVLIRDCQFLEAKADDSLNLKYGKFLIESSFFGENNADAIDLDFVTGEVINSTFEKNGNDSIDVSGARVLIKNNTISNSGDKCISIGEESETEVVANVLDSCSIGIEIKDSSVAHIEDNQIINNNIGINAYQKKVFFEGGRGEVYTTIFDNNREDIDYKNTSTGVKFDTDNSEIVVH